MFLGVDYYPHYFNDSDILTDLQNIKSMNANYIRIGDFAWYLMEKTEGEYDFSYFINIVKIAKSLDIGVMICTPTSTFPAWLKHKYPEIMMEKEKGKVVAFGGRREYCYNSKVYLEYAIKISVKMTEAFKEYDNVNVIQIDNEFGHEGSDICYCDKCQAAFQEYLKSKYGSIDNLNEVAGNVFWSKSYNSFAEIEVPSTTITYHNPTMSLEWAKFRSYSINNFSEKLVEAVRSVKRADQQVTHNLFPGFLDVCFDQFELSKQYDFISYDNYPVWGGLEEPVSPCEIAFTHDYIRGLKNQNYWIVEEIMGAQGHDIIGYLPRPNQAKLWAYQAFAHGCENLLFFSYRTAAKGQEQFCYGLVDQDNSNGRRYHEAKDFFTDIVKYKNELTATIKSRVAIVYDFANTWGFKSQRQSYGFEIKNELLRFYRGFYNYNVKIDVVNSNANLDDYDIIIFPVMQIISEKLYNYIEKLTHMNKQIIFSYRSGLKDENANVHYSAPPCLISNMVGGNIVEIESLSRNKCVDIKVNDQIFKLDSFREIIKLTTGESFGEYLDHEFIDNVAISKNQYNSSTIYYVGGGLCEAGCDYLAKKLIDELKIDYIISEHGVEIYDRNELRFIINHNNYEAEINNEKLAPFGVKMMYINS